MNLIYVMKFFSFLLVLFMSVQLTAQTQNSTKNHIIQEWKLPNETFPRFVKFDGKVAVDPEEHGKFIRELFDLPEEYSVILSDKIKDQMGWMHYTYALNFKGIPIRHNAIKIHMNGSFLVSVNAALDKVSGSITW